MEALCSRPPSPTAASSICFAIPSMLWCGGMLRRRTRGTIWTSSRQPPRTVTRRPTQCPPRWSRKTRTAMTRARLVDAVFQVQPHMRNQHTLRRLPQRCALGFRSFRLLGARIFRSRGASRDRRLRRLSASTSRSCGPATMARRKCSSLTRAQSSGPSSRTGRAKQTLSSA